MSIKDFFIGGALSWAGIGILNFASIFSYNTYIYTKSILPNITPFNILSMLPIFGSILLWSTMQGLYFGIIGPLGTFIIYKDLQAQKNYPGHYY